MKNKIFFLYVITCLNLISFVSGNAVAGVPSADLKVNEIRNAFADSNPLQFPNLAEGSEWNCNRYEATGEGRQITEIQGVSFGYAAKKITQVSNGSENLVYSLENGERVANDLNARSHLVLRSPEDGSIIIEVTSAPENVSSTMTVDAIAVFGEIAVAYIDCKL